MQQNYLTNIYIYIKFKYLTLNLSAKCLKAKDLNANLPPLPLSKHELIVYK